LTIIVRSNLSVVLRKKGEQHEKNNNNYSFGFFGSDISSSYCSKKNEEMNRKLRGAITMERIDEVKELIKVCISQPHLQVIKL